MQRYILLFVVLSLLSCRQSNRPDVDKIDLNVKIERFDQDLYWGKNQKLKQTDSLLSAKYGAFYEDFIFRMLGNATYTRQQVLKGLYDDQKYSELNHVVDSVYPNLKKQEEDFTQAFKYIKYYYPKVQIPRFIAFLSGFSYQSPIGDDYLGIGLDMFLGAENKYYAALVQSIPQYLARRFTPDYIVPRTTEVFLRENLVKERDEDRSLLAKMIYNGKILYFLDQIMPENMPDSMKIGYTQKQLDWCKTYEGNIWAYYLENNFIYETDYNKIQVFLGDGPFTPGIGENHESAPKLGVWTGWQLVRQYMKENPELTLQQLMKETDAQTILSKSKYKPKIGN